MNIWIDVHHTDKTKLGGISNTHYITDKNITKILKDLNQMNVIRSS